MGGLGKLPLPLPVYIVNSRMSLTNQALSDMASGSGATGFGGRTARAAGKATGARRGAFAVARNMASRGGASPVTRWRSRRRAGRSDRDRFRPCRRYQRGGKGAERGRGRGLRSWRRGRGMGRSRRGRGARKRRPRHRHGHRRRAGRGHRRRVRKRGREQSGPHDCRRLHQPGSGKSHRRGDGQAGGKTLRSPSQVFPEWKSR